jgi:hypothetical protein
MRIHNEWLPVIGAEIKPDYKRELEAHERAKATPRAKPLDAAVTRLESWVQTWLSMVTDPRGGSSWARETRDLHSRISEATVTMARSYLLTGQPSLDLLSNDLRRMIESTVDRLRENTT